MGKKINPKIFRIATIFNWNSTWFSDKDKFGDTLMQDIKIKKFLEKRLKEGGIEKINIERYAGKIVLNISAARPGMIIGKSGAGVERLKREILNKFIKSKTELNINIKEVERPALSAPLVVQSIIADLEKRVPFRRAVKQAMGRVERAGALGVKVIVAGRLNGVEIARTETFSSGKIPLHTLRANIDYSRSAARTVYGAIGVKVWINKGEVFSREK